jgi:outer membrane receptor protein involved in Fe transport
MKKQLNLSILFLFLTSLGIAQTTSIVGTILEDGKKPLVGATILLLETSEGTTSDINGNFEITASLPVKLRVSLIGYESQEIFVQNNDKLEVMMKVSNELLNVVVITASRTEENILRSPVSIEKLDYKAIQQSPSANFYDALNNLKGLDMVTSSLTFKQINTRGFNTTGNSRFLQLVDGVDNQSAGLGFAMGNLFGPHDLDVKSIELIPGAASALYGPIAFNGMLQTHTKSPFEFQGLSAQTKIGVNHIGDGTDLGAKPYFDLGVRYAKSINDKFAFKINLAHMRGTDWYANDFTDIDPNTPLANRGPNNPGRNALNIYGDEVATTLPGIGRVSRTGYEESDLAQYGVYNTKLNGALHYKLNNDVELIYQANYSAAKAQYTGSSRFIINNFSLVQNRLEIKGKTFYIKAYSNKEYSNDSYNSRSLGQLLNRTWVQDLNGNPVSPNLADATWFERYGAAYRGNVSGVLPNNHSNARAFADQGRLIPNSDAFNEAKDRLIQTQGLQGAGIFSECGLRHIEGMYDLSSYVDNVLNIQIGGNLRRYILNTQGTLFDDKDKNLTNDELGAFIQASKSIWDEKLKFIVSGRYDKNENFDGRFTPRASMVLSPNQNHHFRASYQTGFRNPTIGDQYIKLNVGPIIILGGAPSNSEGLNAYTNSYTAASVGAFGAAAGGQLGQGVPFPTAVSNNINLLQKSNVPFVQPEKVNSFEIGYKGVISQKLLFDVGYYHSQYTDFLINTVVISPNNSILLPGGNLNPAAAGEILGGQVQAYQLYTNASDKVSIQGVSAGLSYLMPKNYKIHANATWSDFNLLDANPSNIPAFNTPTWKTNIVFSNANLTEKLGFSVAWHWQDSFDWFGTFNSLNPGKIDAYSLIDAQISYSLPNLNTIIKLGAANLANKYIVQAYGSPAVGGLYYVSFNFDEAFNKF